MGVSLKPSDAVAGGGLLDDEDVKIVESKFTMFDYGGKAQPVPALMWKLDRMDGTDPISQYWSMGKALDWIPSDDGKELVPIGRATELIESSNGMLLITSVINAGIPESKLGDDATIFEGMECHVNRIAAPVRKGLNQAEGKTILTVTKIHKLPWEKAAATPAAKGKGGGKRKPAAGKGKAAAAVDDGAADIDALATEFILGVLANDETMQGFPDGIPKAKLAPECFATLASDDPNRSAIVRKVFDDTFLNAGPWSYTGGKISMG